MTCDDYSLCATLFCNNSIDFLPFNVAIFLKTCANHHTLLQVAVAAVLNNTLYVACIVSISTTLVLCTCFCFLFIFLGGHYFWSTISLFSSGGIKGGMGENAPPVGGSALPLAPPVRRKNDQNQPFSANFWIFAPSESHFAPSMPPTKKFLVPPLLFRQEVNYPIKNCKNATRNAKGRKVSGNFGNFPWKVSGILKGWEFSEILGIFNFDLFSTFYETVWKSTEFILH